MGNVSESLVCSLTLMSQRLCIISILTFVFCSLAFCVAVICLV